MTHLPLAASSNFAVILPVGSKDSVNRMHTRKVSLVHRDVLQEWFTYRNLILCAWQRSFFLGTSFLFHLQGQISFYLQPMNGVPVGKKTCNEPIQYNVWEPPYPSDPYSITKEWVQKSQVHWWLLKSDWLDPYRNLMYILNSGYEA